MNEQFHEVCNILYVEVVKLSVGCEVVSEYMRFAFYHLHTRLITCTLA